MNQSVHKVETVLYSYSGLLGLAQWSEDQITKCQCDYSIRKSDPSVSHIATVGGNHLILRFLFLILTINKVHNNKTRKLPGFSADVYVLLHVK